MLIIIRTHDILINVLAASLDVAVTITAFNCRWFPIIKKAQVWHFPLAKISDLISIARVTFCCFPCTLYKNCSIADIA